MACVRTDNHSLILMLLQSSGKMLLDSNHFYSFSLPLFDEILKPFVYRLLSYTYHTFKDTLEHILVVSVEPQICTLPL